MSFEQSQDGCKSLVPPGGISGRRRSLEDDKAMRKRVKLQRIAILEKQGVTFSRPKIPPSGIPEGSRLEPKPFAHPVPKIVLSPVSSPPGSRRRQLRNVGRRSRSCCAMKKECLHRTCCFHCYTYNPDKISYRDHVKGMPGSNITDSMMQAIQGNLAVTITSQGKSGAIVTARFALYLFQTRLTIWFQIKRSLRSQYYRSVT